MSALEKYCLLESECGELPLYSSLLFFANVAKRAKQPFVLKGPKSVLSASDQFMAAVRRSATTFRSRASAQNEREFLATITRNYDVSGQA